MAPTKPSSSPSSTSITKAGPKKAGPQKLRRNERERKRVDTVNQGFNLLRDHVPRQAGCKQKMSKVETLREAARYIQLLQDQLGIVTCPSSSLDFPTREHSPSYPAANCSHNTSLSSASSFDYNNISPYYPHPHQNHHHHNYDHQSSQYSNSCRLSEREAGDTTKCSGMMTSADGTTTTSSPGSNSFYSDASSLDEYLH